MKKKNFFSIRKTVLAQTTFPYIGKSFPNNNWTPFRERDENYQGNTLARIFQPLWDSICTGNPGVFLGERIDKDIFCIAQKNIKPVSRGDEIILCRGNIDMRPLPISYTLTVTPSSEPDINLLLFLGNFKLSLCSHYWDIVSYRPADFQYRPMWFSLHTEKFEYIEGKYQSIEDIDLGYTDFSYTGPTFLGNGIERETSFCQVASSKFRMKITGIEIKFTGPFIQKLNEHLKPFGLILQR